MTNCNFLKLVLKNSNLVSYFYTYTI